MSQTAKPYHSIKSLSELIGVPASTLRYWETMFPQLAPKRTKTGRRLYSSDEADTAIRIKELLHDKGLKIEAAKEILNATRKHPPRKNITCNSGEDASGLLREVAKMVADNLYAVECLKAVDEWIRVR